jgi:hypothetical protein
MKSRIIPLTPHSFRESVGFVGTSIASFFFSTLSPVCQIITLGALTVGLGNPVVQYDSLIGYSTKKNYC